MLEDPVLMPINWLKFKAEEIIEKNMIIYHGREYIELNSL